MNKGSHGWVFSSAAHNYIATGAGPDDGHPTSMSSYISELGSILAALYIIHRICDYYEITAGQATLYCDNKGAITNSFKSSTPGISPFLSPNYNLLILVKQLITATPITIVGEWVKGHYSGKDRKKQHDLNGKADELVWEHLSTQDSREGTNTSMIPIYDT
jgi:hypothetical protein